MKIPPYITFRTTPGQFGHPASYRASCNRCGWDIDSRNDPYWETRMLNHNCAPDGAMLSELDWTEHQNSDAVALEGLGSHVYTSNVRIPRSLRIIYLGNNTWIVDCHQCDYHAELVVGNGDLGAAFARGLFHNTLTHTHA